MTGLGFAVRADKPRLARRANGNAAAGPAVPVSGLVPRRGKHESPDIDRFRPIIKNRPHGRGGDCYGLTTWMGLPARKARMLSVVMAMIRCRASVGAQAIWGVSTQLGAVSRGVSALIGSRQATSAP